MYNNYFGLSEAPFNITPNSRFFFPTDACDEILKVLRHGIVSRKGVIVVTGEAGTGKTLLLKFLEQDLAPEVKAVVLQNPHTDFDTILELLLKRLELHSPCEDRTARLERLTCHLIEQRSHGVMVCLLVDEAQDLDAHTLDEIRLMANLESQGDALLPVVLIGQPDLNDKLDQPCAARIRQRISLARTTHRLIRMEVGPYIRSRLQVAGYSGNALFGPDAVNLIGVYSGGIPRLINSLCDNSLMRAYAANERMISAEIVEQAARDLRITNGLQPRREITPPKLPDLSSPSANTVEHAANAREQSRAEPAQRLLAEFCGPALQQTDHIGTTQRGESSPANLRENGLEKSATLSDSVTDVGCAMITSKKHAQELSDCVSPLANLKAHTEKLRQKLACRLGGYCVGATLAVTLLLIVSSARLGVVYSSKTSPQHRSVGDALSHSYSERDHMDHFSKARFVSPAIDLAQEQIDLGDFLNREGSARAPGTSANGKTTEGVKAAPSERKRAEEPRRAGTGVAVPLNGNRIEDTPKTVRVIADSLLRKRPSASAEIIGTLEPGSRVTVLAKAGDFYQVRSLDNSPIRGYVHREDAFFERKK
ncbi:MAG TPA: AAA family ATPase [Candidatus Binatia bacterium]|nr:AAA family ATPase [Candidatus Binatia bacterium]